MARDSPYSFGLVLSLLVHVEPPVGEVLEDELSLGEWSAGHRCLVIDQLTQPLIAADGALEGLRDLPVRVPGIEASLDDPHDLGEWDAGAKREFWVHVPGGVILDLYARGWP